jgi:hypothetical protein
VIATGWPVDRVMSLSFDAAEEVLSARRRRDAKQVLELAQAITAIAFGDRSSSTSKQEALIKATADGLLRSGQAKPPDSTE